MVGALNPRGQATPAANGPTTTDSNLNESVGSGRAWMRVNAPPVHDEAGNTTSVLAAFADITVEHKLTVEQRRFSHLFRYANDVVIVIGPTGRVSYSSSYSTVL